MVCRPCGSACANARDMTSARDTTWFHDASYDDSACKLLDAALMEKARACMNNAIPELLWGQGESFEPAAEESAEATDIFETAMKNVSRAGSVLIDAIPAGTLS